MRKITTCVFVAICTAPAFVGCAELLPGQEGNQIAENACPADIASLSSIQSAKFGLNAELEAKAKSALKAGASLIEIAADIEADVLEACTNIATDLGVSKSKIEPQGKDSKVQAACAAAANAVSETRASIKGQANVNAKPPRCEASMDAMAKCAAECDATVKPGSVKLECEGGELSGSCEGSCQGSCTVDGSADCKGSCSGDCEGSCSGEIVGKCDGTCNGTCEGKNVSGKCEGTCRGQCQGKVDGQCSATCEGKCDASCEMKASGKCEGTCSGKCSVEFKEPKCDGEIKAPEVSAECEAECNAKVTAEIKCEPGQVNMNASVDADTESVQRLAATLEKNLPALLRVGTSMSGRLQSVAASTEASLKGMKATVEGAGSNAVQVGACFVASLQAQAQASASINVSVQASASVSGKATGSTN